jgi:regulator of replication initiation timing
MGKKTVSDLEELIVNMSASIDCITTKLSNMEDLLNASLEENKRLKTELTEKNKTIGDMACKINTLEVSLNRTDQYQRSWSVRIANVPLSSEEEDNPSAVKQKVYDLAIRPILVGAHAKGLIPTVPDADGLLEVAHVLPAKSGSNKPIIARLYNRNLRAACLKMRKEYAPRTGGGDGRGGGTASGRAGTGARVDGPDGRGRYTYPVYEDLTRANFLKMRELAAHEKIQSCWTINGQLRFKLHDSTTIHRVKSVFETADQILQQL